MNCKQAQLLIASRSSLPADAINHAAECSACRDFERDVAALELAAASLDAEPPLLLRSRIREKIANNRGLNWRPFAISAAILAVLSIPMIQVVSKKLAHDYVKGDRIGTLPPFHTKIYGKDQLSVGSDANAELWFNGYADRLTSPGIDMISDVEHGICYQHWKPDGVAQKRAEVWGTTTRKVTAKEQAQVLDRLGPVALSFGVKVSEKAGIPIQVFGHSYVTVATTYRLPVSKVGSLTSVEKPTDEIVYRVTGTGQIARTEFVTTLPGGSNQTDVHDFEYVVPSDDKFETRTLASTRVTMPAVEARAKGSG